ncbi:MAG: hypothetical protein WC338_02060 [Candidatus Ratteibacteria bacterium]|jgi:WD40 repeat protein
MDIFIKRIKKYPKTNFILLIIVFLTATVYAGEVGFKRTALEKLIGRFDSATCKRGTFTVSSDGIRVAWIEKVGGNELAVVDGHQGKAYKTIGSDIGESGLEGPPVFSPDSKKVAYAADIGHGCRIVENEQEGKYVSIGPIIYSPDSRFLAYPGRVDGKWFIVVNEQEREKCNHPRNIVFSPDSKRLVYSDSTQNDDEWFIVVNGQERKYYDGFVGDIFLSPDSQRAAYLVEPKARGRFVVIDGQEISGDAQLGPTVFSPDSKKVAHVMFSSGKQRHKEFMVVNGQKEKEYNEIRRDLIFSPDSKHLAYVVKNSYTEELVVVDGQEGKPYCSIGNEVGVGGVSGRPAFSPDSKKLAYVADTGHGCCVVVNEKEEKYYDFVSPCVFSPDSKRLAYTAGSGQKRDVWSATRERFAVIDGSEGKL